MLLGRFPRCFWVGILEVVALALTSITNYWCRVWQVVQIAKSWVRIEGVSVASRRVMLRLCLVKGVLCFIFMTFVYEAGYYGV